MHVDNRKYNISPCVLTIDGKEILGTSLPSIVALHASLMSPPHFRQSRRAQRASLNRIREHGARTRRADRPQLQGALPQSQDRVQVRLMTTTTSAPASIPSAVPTTAAQCLFLSVQAVSSVLRAP